MFHDNDEYLGFFLRPIYYKGNLYIYILNAGGDFHRPIDEFEGCKKGLPGRKRKSSSAGLHRFGYRKG